MPTPRQVALLVYDEVEVLDFAGPFEVFAVTGRDENPRPFSVSLVAPRPGPITARNGLSVNPHFTLADCPPPDVLVIPGGYGSRREMQNAELLDWVRRMAERTELILSVCTGSLILGKAGLLDGLQATTHHGAYDLLRLAAPTATVREGERFLDNGQIVTAAGVAAGIDAAFHVVARLLGTEVAEQTARYIEYPWKAM